jgi:hypothetical protein
LLLAIASDYQSSGQGPVMLLDEGLNVRKFKPNHGSRPFTVTHARDADARKLPPLCQLVNERKADPQNPFNLFCVKQLHHWPFFCKSPVFYNSEIISTPVCKGFDIYIFSRCAFAGAVPLL